VTKIFLGGGSYQSQSLIAGAQRSLNLYAEEIPTAEGEAVPPKSVGATSQPPAYIYYPVPGMVGLSSTVNLTAHLFPYSDVELTLIVPPLGCYYLSEQSLIVGDTFTGSGFIDDHTADLTSTNWLNYPNNIGNTTSFYGGDQLTGDGLNLTSASSFFGTFGMNCGAMVPGSHTLAVITAAAPDYGFVVVDQTDFGISFEIHNPQAAVTNIQGFNVVVYAAITAAHYTSSQFGTNGQVGFHITTSDPSGFARFETNLNHTGYLFPIPSTGNIKCVIHKHQSVACHFLQRSVDGYWWDGSVFQPTQRAFIKETDITEGNASFTWNAGGTPITIHRQILFNHTCNDTIPGADQIRPVNLRVFTLPPSP
jgi:hypothetical protein